MFGNQEIAANCPEVAAAAECSQAPLPDSSKADAVFSFGFGLTYAKFMFGHFSVVLPRLCAGVELSVGLNLPCWKANRGAFEVSLGDSSANTPLETQFTFELKRTSQERG